MSAAWTDLGGGLLVRRSAAFQMNSVILLDADHAVLVDPGVLPSELDDIARRVGEEACAAITLLLTHAHWDHVVGRPWWPNAEVVAHDLFASETRRDRGRILSEIQALATAHGETWDRGFEAYRPDMAVSGLCVLKRGPWTLVLRDAPGHADSQLTIHLPRERALIAADMLSDIEIPTLTGPCAPYLRTLRDLLPLAENGAIETLIPGHGSVALGRDAILERLRRDLDYLERLEREVAAARAARLASEAARKRLTAFDYGGAALAGQALKDHLENVSEEWAGNASLR